MRAGSRRAAGTGCGRRWHGSTAKSCPSTARACAVPTTGIGGWGLCIRIGAQFQANRLVLVQTAVDNKPNASTAIPELLRMLCLKGCIVTLDAMGCQKAIARPIRQQGADYVLRIRDNHKGLHARLEDTFALERAGHFASYAHDYADPVGKDHGRIAIRRCWTTGDPDHEWGDLASLVWVECELRIGNRVTTDVRIFMSSLPPQGPAPAAGRAPALAGTLWVRKRPLPGPGCGLRRGRQPHSHGVRRPQHRPSSSASATTSSGRTAP